MEQVNEVRITNCAAYNSAAGCTIDLGNVIFVIIVSIHTCLLFAHVEADSVIITMQFTVES